MKLPNLAAPNMRRMRSAAVIEKIIPQWKNYTSGWIGTAPYCAGDCQYCYKHGWECEQDYCGDGACCTNGWKVRCYENV